MKTDISLFLLSLFLVSCNPNPSKEARIQKLETELQAATENISGLETTVKLLQSENDGLVMRVKDLEAL